MVYVAPDWLTGKGAPACNADDNRNGAGSVRTGLTIIMMMFFAGLALDLTVPAVILGGALLLDGAARTLARGYRPQLPGMESPVMERMA
jgi:hypothetical protein